MDHPAEKLGQWLRLHRKSLGLIPRVFAGQIHLSPAEYAEVEHGIGQWLQEDQEELVLEVLRLSVEEAVEFKDLLSAARNATPRRFDEVFTREQLEPIRARGDKIRGQLTAETKDAILDAVFEPLS